MLVVNNIVGLVRQFKILLCAIQYWQICPPTDTQGNL